MTQEYNCYANTLLKKEKIEKAFTGAKQSVISIHNITLTTTNNKVGIIYKDAFTEKETLMPNLSMECIQDY